MPLFRLLFLAACLLSSAPAIAQDCTDPDGTHGDILYNKDYGVFQGCALGGWEPFHPPSYPLGCSSSGLVGHWKLNESGNVSTADDSSPNSNDGTLTNFPADPSANWVAGKVGNALDFDGTDDYVKVGNVLNFGTGSFTASVWTKVGATINTKVVMAKKANGLSETSGWRITLNNFEDLEVNIGNGSAGVTVNVPIGDTAFHHLAMVVDRSDNKLRTYVDGVEASAAANISAVGSVSNTTSFNIGNMGNLNSPFKGQIDDVRIYNRALDATEISALYNGGAGCQ
jgi:hypothetical protein